MSEDRKITSEVPPTGPGLPFDQELDVTGLTCPMPLLKAKKALNGMAPAQCLQVLATDPGSQRDFETFARQSGNKLLESRLDGDVFVYLLQKKQPPAQAR